MDANTGINKTSVLNTVEPPSGVDIAGSIAGYELQERIGAGGYGEVWKAIGPGGLTKAVKILHGRLDGQQAEVELRSLERIRELRHPFLLNIERIEVCDGRLVVVSELADFCMEQRFEQATKEGLKGIPRDELLGYLRDSADALDFMSDRGGLQHLDIKPGNLLLQGEHAKVGDFGLTKDLTATGVSIMGGFTPLYSSPEIFEGSPSRQSDQYSLAIVYQTMLTGQPPFGGRTAAQLTAQHLSSSPDLMPLQPADRPVIARALSKSPKARFGTCREFVDALSRRKSSTVPSKVSSRGGYQALPANVKSTRVVNAETMAATSDAPLLEVKPIKPDVRDAPKLTYRPTVIVGVGGLGGRVVQGLKSRLEQEFDADALAAFPLLYLDTDSHSLNAARSRDDVARLDEKELLHIPLKSSSEYRANKDRPLNWLSRRWLFNVPKSRQVEGMRPLGRLALVDQQENVRQKLTAMISSAVSETASQQTSSVTGLPIEPGSVDVFVIASTAGGTGSGCVLDIGYLVRELCEGLDLKVGQLTGILCHATGTARQTSDIQEACTISLLRELQHYNTPGLIESRGLLPNDATNEAKPFDHTFLIHLGDELSEAQFHSSSQSVSDYLFASLATPARRELVGWREKESADSDASPTSLRTFGVASIREGTFRAVHEESLRLSRSIAELWATAGNADSDGSESSAAIAAETRELLEGLTLTAQRLAASLSGVLGEEGTSPLATFARQRADLILAKSQQATLRQDAQFVRIANELLKNSTGDNSQNGGALLAAGQAALRQLLPSVESISTELFDHLSSLLDRPLRFSGAETALGEILTVLDSATQNYARMLKIVAAEIKGLCTPPPTPAGQQNPADSGQSVDSARLDELCRQCCSYAVFHAVREHLAQVRQELGGSAAKMLALRGKVSQLAKHHVHSSKAGTNPTSVELASFDRFLLSGDHFRLANLLDDIDEGTIWARLRESAAEYWRANSLSDAQTPSNAHPNFPKSANPALTGVGGGRRALGILPEGAAEEYWRGKFAEEFGDCVSLEKTATDNVTVFCEIEGFEISHVINNFVRHHPHLSEVAERIHTRNDIDW